MILGTHNSATSGKLVWWQRPFALLLHLTSRCQDRNIREQIEDGVRLFNLQVCLYKGEWRISHGLCIYEERLTDILKTLKDYSRANNEIIFQLYLDKNFFVRQKEEEFIRLVGGLKRAYCSPNFILEKAWIEGTNKYPHKTGYKLSIEEHYWSQGWAKLFANGWLDKLPLPKRHAKKHNKAYKLACKSEYLMLDYYDE